MSSAQLWTGQLVMARSLRLWRGDGGVLPHVVHGVDKLLELLVKSGQGPDSRGLLLAVAFE
ncbi:hypothetical protein GCM10028895_51240 [Pontibacter rugosus]